MDLLTLTAVTVGLHIGSVHSPSKPEDNNNNLGAYICIDNSWCAGGYRNTLDRDSFYLTKIVPLGKGFDLRVGAVSGYQEKCTTVRVQKGTKLTVTGRQNRTETISPIWGTEESCTGHTDGAITAAAVLTWAPTSWSVKPRFFYIPPFEKNGRHVLSLSLEF